VRLGVVPEAEGWPRWGCSRCGRVDSSDARDLPDADRRLNRGCDAPSPIGRTCPWSAYGASHDLVLDGWRRLRALGEVPDGPPWYVDGVLLAAEVEREASPTTPPRV
jgi:hypothetical protein